MQKSAISNNVPHRSYKDVLLYVGGIQRVQVERPHTGQQIHPMCSHEPTSLIPGPNLPENEERNDDRRREILLEKVLGAGTTTDGLSSKSA